MLAYQLQCRIPVLINGGGQPHKYFRLEAPPPHVDTLVRGHGLVLWARHLGMSFWYLASKSARTTENYFRLIGHKWP